MVKTIFTNDGGKNRCAGYATVPYSTDADSETVVETTEDDLASVFDQAKADGETLDGADQSIDAAIDDPLAFCDFLILDSNDAIVFDPDYAREDPASTSA